MTVENLMKEIPQMTMTMETPSNDVEIDMVNVGEIDGQLLSPPIHAQAAMRSLNLNPLLTYMEEVIKTTASVINAPAPQPKIKSENFGPEDGVKFISGVPITRAERTADRTRLYNFSRVRKKRKWMKSVLVDDSSDEDDDSDRDQRIRHLLKMHKYRRSLARDYKSVSEEGRYMYYSSSILSNVDLHKEGLENESGKMKTESVSDQDPEDADEYSDWFNRRRNSRRLTAEEVEVKKKNIWADICKYHVPNAHKLRSENRCENLAKLRRVSSTCMRECRRVAMKSQRVCNESVNRAKKLAKQVLSLGKVKVKVEIDSTQKSDDSEVQREVESVEYEARRQDRKSNFFITQMELYAHIMAKRITGRGDEFQNKILEQLNDKSSRGSGDSSPDDSRTSVLQSVEDVYEIRKAKRRAYCQDVSGDGGEHDQPILFNGVLKPYQLDGFNWLIRLYEEGLNGILADELGLGKTIQSLAFLAYLAESRNTWGPFLIVAPASALHSWQEECARFLPNIKCVPYWGSVQDRKVLRNFWEIGDKKSGDISSFHVVITSYQIVIQDVKYLQRIDWQYMILDEAEAIKCSQSARWKILLGFSCRNRLLLSLTPAQSNLAELWALLHFIMPTLFDCHEEINDWFSKDIESQADSQSPVFDENQLTRLRQILSPFILRREKKEVEDQLADKVEIVVPCSLTSRQRLLYEALKNRIVIDDLLSFSRVSTQSTTQTNTLMSLVMQFRKVCNHPDLIDRREAISGVKLLSIDYNVPRLLFPVIDKECGSILYKLMYLHHQDYVQKSLADNRENGEDSVFSFTRFTNLSPMDYAKMFSGLKSRWLAVLEYWKTAFSIHLNHIWREKQHLPVTLLLQPLRYTSPSNVFTSLHLRELVFTSVLMTSYGHVDHVIKCRVELAGHERISVRSVDSSPRLKMSAPVSPAKSPVKVALTSHSAPVSPRSIGRIGAEISPRKVEKPIPEPKIINVLTDWPKFTYYSYQKVRFPPRSWYCSDRAAETHRQFQNHCGSREAMLTLLYGSPSLYEEYERNCSSLNHSSVGGLLAVEPVHGYSGIITAGKESILTDSGKLHALDLLLTRLKSEGHRVLIYCQMTRMIDILEEYMWHRKHTYIRLDGSSKIADRRDMIADFQSRTDIFVFLLSTRAGGLGINLTAADTVIFYDSDWNPGVDAQALDRAQRLGQTRQVTVYRLVTSNTIEERILDRAKAKSQIQNVIMKGSAVRHDALKPTEVVSLLLDDEEMQARYDRQISRRGSRTRKDDLDKESVVSLESGATSPVSVMSDHPFLHNESSNDALYIAEESGSNDPSPKRRRGPVRSASKRPRRSVMPSTVEVPDGNSRTLRTRSVNQTTNPANE